MSYNKSFSFTLAAPFLLMVVILIFANAAVVQTSPTLDDFHNLLEAKLTHLEARLEAQFNERIGQLEAENKQQEALIESLVHNQNKASPTNNADSIRGGDVNAITDAKVMPTTCRELALSGQTFNGLYLVPSVGLNRVETVACDFTLAPSSPGYERRVGYNDIKTDSGFYFQVQRNLDIFGKTVLHYQLEKLNVGGAMNIATGTFTVPTNGVYSFSFFALSIGSASVSLHLNGVQIAVSDTHIDINSISLSSILKLKKGDTVDTRLNFGGLYGGNQQSFATFNGMLIEEDLLL